MIKTNLLLSTYDIELYNNPNGGKIIAHPISLGNRDFDDCLKVAYDLANEGNIIKILPIINDPGLRNILLPKNVKHNKNPDYLINGQLIADLKSPTGEKPTKNTISNLLSDAHNQSNGIVLVIPDSYCISENDLYEQINQKLHRPQYNDFEVYLKYKGQWSIFTQKQWKVFYAEKESR